MPRRIAAGALFTAAVGVSVGAIAAPAQADAFAPQHTVRTVAHVPELRNHNGVRNPVDAYRGRDENRGVWSLVNADKRVHVQQDDRRDCPPYRDRGLDEQGALASIVYTVHQTGSDDGRDRGPDRIHTSAYTIGDDIRVGDRHDRDGRDGHGRDGHRHDGRHDGRCGHGGQGPRGR